MLSISPESVFFAIVKAREFDVKDAVTEPDPGSNAADEVRAGSPLDRGVEGIRVRDEGSCATVTKVLRHRVERGG